jgi:hypothetical protein
MKILTGTNSHLVYQSALVAPSTLRRSCQQRHLCCIPQYWLVSCHPRRLWSEWEVGEGNENLVYPSPCDFKRSFTCRKILRHGTSGFTSRPKEGVLRICIALKSPSPWPGPNPQLLGPVASTLTTTTPRRHSHRNCLIQFDRLQNVCSRHVGLPLHCLRLRTSVTVTNWLLFLVLFFSVVASSYTLGVTDRMCTLMSISLWAIHLVFTNETLTTETFHLIWSKYLQPVSTRPSHGLITIHLMRRLPITFNLIVCLFWFN